MRTTLAAGTARERPLVRFSRRRRTQQTRCRGRLGSDPPGLRHQRLYRQPCLARRKPILYPQNEYSTMLATMASVFPPRVFRTVPGALLGKANPARGSCTRCLEPLQSAPCRQGANGRREVLNHECLPSRRSKLRSLKSFKTARNHALRSPRACAQARLRRAGTGRGSRSASSAAKLYPL
jgi:hypothetical protein